MKKINTQIRNKMRKKGFSEKSQNKLIEILKDFSIHIENEGLVVTKSFPTLRLRIMDSFGDDERIEKVLNEIGHSQNIYLIIGYLKEKEKRNELKEEIYIHKSLIPFLNHYEPQDVMWFEYKLEEKLWELDTNNKADHIKSSFSAYLRYSTYTNFLLAGFLSSAMSFNQSYLNVFDELSLLQIHQYSKSLYNTQEFEEFENELPKEFKLLVILNSLVELDKKDGHFEKIKMTTLNKQLKALLSNLKKDSELTKHLGDIFEFSINLMIYMRDFIILEKEGTDFFARKINEIFLMYFEYENIKIENFPFYYITNYINFSSRNIISGTGHVIKEKKNRLYDLINYLGEFKPEPKLKLWNGLVNFYSEEYTESYHLFLLSNPFKNSPKRVETTYATMMFHQMKIKLYFMLRTDEDDKMTSLERELENSENWSDSKAIYLQKMNEWLKKNMNSKMNRLNNELVKANERFLNILSQLIEINDLVNSSEKKKIYIKIIDELRNFSIRVNDKPWVFKQVKRMLEFENELLKAEVLEKRK